jgi:hypothetical protein
MAASLSLRVYTSTNAATESGVVTGIDFISADNATNSLGNRQANPITVGTNSYEKWLKLKVDTAPANSVSNFKIWGDGGVMTSTTLNWTGSYITGTTPVATSSTIANTTSRLATRAPGTPRPTAPPTPPRSTRSCSSSWMPPRVPATGPRRPSTTPTTRPKTRACVRNAVVVQSPIREGRSTEANGLAVFEDHPPGN